MKEKINTTKIGTIWNDEHAKWYFSIVDVVIK